MHCVLLAPGDLETPTGGFVYARRLVETLRERGWSMPVLRIDGAWPLPDESTLRQASEAIADLPDGTLVLADGLAYGALGDTVARHAQRLRWVALVHHPLHLETGLDERVARGLREAEAQALRHARRVVVCSAYTAFDVAELGVPAEDIVVVEPGNDMPFTPQERLDAPGVQLLCVASLIPRKDHALLLAALEGLGELDWTLHCVGSATRDTAHAQALMDASAHGLLAQRVVWHGELNGEALHARYARADVFVLASRHEGFGMVINEALLHGLPIVASNAGALAHTVPAKAGLLVDAGDVPAWREALRTLITDADRRGRLAAGAREAARLLPSWTQQAARMAAALEGVP